VHHRCNNRNSQLYATILILLIFFYLVGCLYYCINDVRSQKHQTANGIRKCNAKNRVRFVLSIANPSHCHWTISFPTCGITDSIFLIAGPPPPWHCGPTRAMAFSFLRFLDHTQRRTTVRRTPLDEWSAHRRDLYLQNTQHPEQLVFLIHCPFICLYFSESLQAQLGHDHSLCDTCRSVSPPSLYGVSVLIPKTTSSYTHMKISHIEVQGPPANQAIFKC